MSNSNTSESRKKFSIKINKKIFIVIIILIIAAASGYKIKTSLYADKGLEKIAYTILKLGNSINRINVKGEVKGEDTVKISSEVTFPIKEVNFEEGDRVKKGDILAVLDVSSLEDKIEELESSIKTDDQANAIIVANAKAAYDSALKLSSEENNSDIQNAVSALEVAKTDYENKKNLYEKNKVLFDNGVITEQQLKDCEVAYDTAKSIYEKYTVALDNIKEKVQLNLTTAKNNYDAAVVKSQDNTKKITVENLKKDLVHKNVVSTSDGIIISKNAAAGNNSVGTLFEIQDENNTNVVLKVKEIDIQKISINQKVEMKTDSMGDSIINGQVIDIHDIACDDDKSMLDLESNSEDKEAEYEVKVKIIDTDCKVKIGMKVQADIITDEKDGVYTVPIESIIKDKDDNDCVYIAEKNNDGYVVKAVKVTKGTENDSSVEISGDEIIDNVLVLNSPSSYEIGSKVNIKNN